MDLGTWEEGDLETDNLGMRIADFDCRIIVIASERSERGNLTALAVILTSVTVAPTPIVPHFLPGKYVSQLTYLGADIGNNSVRSNGYNRL